MDIPRFVEALSPSETEEIAATLPIDSLFNALKTRGSQQSIEEEKLVIGQAPPEVLQAELLRRGELPADIGSIIETVETKLGGGDYSQDDLKRLIPVSQTCVEATTSLQYRALKARGEVFYAASEGDNGLTRRYIGELAPLSTGRVQQIVEAMRESHEAK